MKALILAAGLGTRLLPFTEHTPKPLFPVMGRPLLDIAIQSLKKAGCEAITINTHHLAGRIQAHVASRDYGIPVCTRYEPSILGTGGSIKNLSDFWDERPFMVVNGDILTDIDLGRVYRFHRDHRYPATLVLFDDPAFNTVRVTDDGFVDGFADSADAPADGLLTFTGIQVLDPQVLRFIPDRVPVSSIEAYRSMLASGLKIKAFCPENTTWKDMGAPERYREAVFGDMAAAAFRKAWPDRAPDGIQVEKLQGDGSDRSWHRLTSCGRSLILADHGIRNRLTTCEVDSFVAIGRHLREKGIPVPEIVLEDTFSGLVFTEDLGDLHLQDAVRSRTDPEEILKTYRQVMDVLIAMSIRGGSGFDTAWTCQTPRYDRQVIIERECRYFAEAFLERYLGMNVTHAGLEEEFTHLADRALEFAFTGFMHRDFQSRNILLKEGDVYLIDFQGGRVGPLQYDLASLLIDPYVDLSDEIRENLTDYCMERLSLYGKLNRAEFLACLRYCKLSRNLQILGAFGYLTRVKGKGHFEAYIPSAVNNLQRALSEFGSREFRMLRAISDRVCAAVKH